VVLEEARLQEQLLRRIACDGEFGERHQVRLGPARLPQPPLHPSDIPRHVPDGGVHLDHGDTKDPHSDLSPPFPPPTRGRVREGPKKTPSLHRWSRGRHCPLTSASVNDVETSLSPINWAQSYHRGKEPVKCILSLVAPQSRGGKAPQVRPDSFPHGFQHRVQVRRRA